MNPFLELGIREEVVNAISELGFEKPSEIQEKAIPVLLTGNDDFVGLAQTGTGKPGIWSSIIRAIRLFSKTPTGINPLPYSGIMFTNLKRFRKIC